MGSIEAYERGKLLGKGSFGCAILAKRKADGKNFVIKEIDMARMPTAEREASHQEAKLLKELNHPNIVRCTECFTTGNKLCIVMDWCSEGDLHCIMQKRKGLPLPEETILDWFVQMCLGLKHVHDRKILHRDLKTQNVFMSTGGLLKLGDFGVSKILNSTWQLAATAVGTPYYLSPEICQNRKYNQKSDIWSLGCVLYEITNGRHAFEAPNMRALIQKIIKGQYTPVPSTRSPELRNLIERMLTLDQAKRPSINELLALTVMKERIQKFLSATLLANEFSHTIIHGKPKPGKIVVGADATLPSPGTLAPSSAAPPAVAKAPLTPVRASGALPSQGARPAASPSPNPVRVSAASPSKAPVSPPPKPRTPALGAIRASATVAPVPSPRKPVLAAPAVRPAAGVPSRPVSVHGARPIARAGGVAPPSPVPARAAPSPVRASSPATAAAMAKAERDAAAAVAARQKLQKEREATEASAAAAGAAAAKKRADAEAASKVRRESDIRRGREMAALQAGREIERMRLEEQCRIIEQDRAKMEVDRKAAESKKAEAEKRSAAQQESARVKALEDEKKKRIEDAKKKKVDDEQQKREAEKKAKEREREDMRSKISAQKKLYFDKQQAAQKAKADAEAAAGILSPQPRVTRSPPHSRPTAPPVLGAPAPRRPWSPVHVPGEARGGGTPPDDMGAAGMDGAGRVQPQWRVSSAEGGVTPEQRRAAWEEQKVAAERNRRQVVQDEGRQGGLAAFLGVPDNNQNGIGQRGGDVAPSADERRQVYIDQQKAAEANRLQVVGDGRAPAPFAHDPDDSHYQRKQKKLEEERLQREQQLAEFQRQNWKEMRDAAERNRMAIMNQVSKPTGDSQQQSPTAPPPLPPQYQPQAQPMQHPSEQEETMDFAAMVKDMQDVLGDEGGGDVGGGCDGADEDHGFSDEVDEDDSGDEGHTDGKFTLNGETINLPVQESDSLFLKVEALRMYLEEALGTSCFLKVYRRLESLSVDDDEAQVSKEFLQVLGQDKLPFLQLVHQLIVTEERINSGDC